MALGWQESVHRGEILEQEFDHLIADPLVVLLLRCMALALDVYREELGPQNGQVPLLRAVNDPLLEHLLVLCESRHH